MHLSRFRATLAVACLSLAPLAACERPTAPQVLAAVDSLDAALVGDPYAVRRLWSRLGFPQDPRDMPMTGDLTLEIDGRQRPYSGFVVEIVVVPLDPDDGYPCARHYSTLYAVGSDRWSIMLGGSNFDEPVEQPVAMCQEGYPHRSPTHVFYFSSEDGKGMEGVGGHERIDLASIQPRPCNFLTGGSDDQRLQRVICEALSFRVSADAEMAWGDGSMIDRALHRDGTRRFVIQPQLLPGMRLTVHCNRFPADSMAHHGCPRYVRP